MRVLMLLLLMTLVTAGCGGGGVAVASDPEDPPVFVSTGLEIRSSTSTVEVAEAVPLRAFMLYADGSEVDVTAEALWSSTRRPVANVREGGRLLGAAPGEAVVQATWKGVTGSLPVTVVPRCQAPPAPADADLDLLAPRAGLLGAQTYLPVSGDFNNDRISDLAWVVGIPYEQERLRDMQLRIALGDGQGGWTHMPDRPYAGRGIVALQAIDVNADGRMDLVTANFYSRDVQVLLGKGDGTFQAPLVDDLGVQLLDLALADVSGDGLLDVCATFLNGVDDSSVQGAVHVRLGRGDGTFGPGWTAARLGRVYIRDGQFVVFPMNLRAGDLTGDGLADLAVHDPGDRTWYTFQYIGVGVDFRQLSATGIFAYDAELADLNVDGHLDLVTHGLVRVYPGLGTGAFGPSLPAPLPDAAEGAGLMVGEFTGDGVLDLAVPHDGVPKEGFTLLRGAGNGTFTVAHSTPRKISGGEGWRGLGRNRPMVAGDFDGDGRIDVMAPGYWSALLRATGTGIALERFLQTDWSLSDVAAGDWNLDCLPDLMTVNSYTHRATIQLGQPDGTWQQSQDFLMEGHSPFRIELADLDLDGQVDAVIHPLDSDRSLTVLKNDGGRFTRTETDIRYPTDFALGDVDGDGFPDLVASVLPRPGLELHRGLGDGSFAPAKAVPLDTAVETVALADMDADGHLDLALAVQPRHLAVLAGRGDGTFEAPWTLEVDIVERNWILPPMLAADLTGDGLPELVVAEQENVRTFVNTGGGMVEERHRAPLDQTLTEDGLPWATGLALFLADLDLDGNLDLLAPGPGVLGLYGGRGDGSFAGPLRLTVGWGDSGQVYDVNRDGRPDLILADPNGVSVSLHP